MNLSIATTILLSLSTTVAATPGIVSKRFDPEEVPFIFNGIDAEPGEFPYFGE